MAFSSTTKYDYIEVVNRMVPEFYRETDFKLYGSEEDTSLVFLGKILKAAIQNDLFLDVSNGTLTGPLDTSTVATNFVPEGRTKIGANEFEQRFLVPFGVNYETFDTTNDLKEWFSSTLIPAIEVNNPSGLQTALSAYGFGEWDDLSSVHEYCTQHLGLFYFLNDPSLSSNTGTSGDASSFFISEFLDPLLRGDEVTEKEAINILFSYFWHSRESSTYGNSFIPSPWASGNADISGNTYLSGTQLLSSVMLQLQVWTDPRLKNHGFFEDSLKVLLGDGTASGLGAYP